MLSSCRGNVIVITFSRSIPLVLVCLLLSSCSRSSSTNQTSSGQPTPAQPARWLLLVAPKLLPDDCEKSEPCTGTPYVRAPYADWTREGEYNSFEECARAINDPQPDPNAELHRQGKLTKGELLVGFRCVLTKDPRLTSQPPYNWETEAQADK
jgi:hypothetical protein